MTDHTGQQLREAILDAMLAEWERPVVVGEDDDRITRYFREIGWGWAIDEHCPGDTYDESIRQSTDAPLDWCGLGIAWVGVHRLGHHLEEGQCVPVRLHREVANTVLPSTYRKDKRGPMEFWDDIEPDPPDPVGVDEIRPGDIITVETSRGLPYGDHFAVVEEPCDVIVTVECNGYGQLGDGEDGRGVVRRTRDYGDVRRVYRLDERHFEYGWSE